MAQFNVSERFLMAFTLFKSLGLDDIILKNVL